MRICLSRNCQQRSLTSWEGQKSPLLPKIFNFLKKLKICSIWEVEDLFNRDVEDLRGLGILRASIAADVMTQAQISPQTEHFYHVYNRGNNRQNIFFEQDNYLYFLRLIRQVFITHAVDVVAYCLMPNHYHLLVYANSKYLSQAMKSLSLSYTKAINKRFDRVGALFQGRFQKVLVTHPNYLAHLIRYIHLNPVKANIVHQPEEWEFSSHSEYAGLRSGTLPNLEFIGQFEECDRQVLWGNSGTPIHSAFRRLLLDE